MNNESTVYVWDIYVRIFHWALLILFFTAYFSGEEENLVHIYSGYAVLGLIIFRVFWGFAGSQYARFSNFIYPPSEFIRYLKTLISGSPKRYLGHNPAGGYMVVALLLSLFAVTLSGLKVYAIEEGRGPFAGGNPEIKIITSVHADRDEYYNEEENNEDVENEEEFWEEIHEISTNITLFLIFLHIAGVFLACHLHKENLIMAMITGRKKA